jgi:hypothetical protein
MNALFKIDAKVRIIFIRNSFKLLFFLMKKYIITLNLLLILKNA